MASGPSPSLQIDGETMETMTDFIFMGSKITGVGDCNHEIERYWLHGRKTMTTCGGLVTKSYPTLQPHGL